MSIHRCHMVEAAIADNRNFQFLIVKLKATGVNYTYVTLARFHNDYPDCELYFILGADSLFDFDSWRHPEEICKYANILAAVRGNLNADEVEPADCISERKISFRFLSPEHAEFQCVQQRAARTYYAGNYYPLHASASG